MSRAYSKSSLVTTFLPLLAAISAAFFSYQKFFNSDALFSKDKAEKDGGVVNIYSSRKEELIKDILHAFTQKTGIKVNHVFDDVVFGLSIVLVNDRTFFIADTAINSAPNAQQIAQIAIKSANTVKSMGHKPSVAIIAHS